MSKYFLKPYERSGGNIKVELDLSNYAMKHRITRKRSKKILNHTENLLRKDIQLKGVC